MMDVSLIGSAGYKRDQLVLEGGMVQHSLTDTEDNYGEGGTYDMNYTYISGPKYSIKPKKRK